MNKRKDKDYDLSELRMLGGPRLNDIREFPSIYDQSPSEPPEVLARELQRIKEYLKKNLSPESRTIIEAYFSSLKEYASSDDLIDNPVLENSVLENPILPNPILDNQVLENRILDNPIIKKKIKSEETKNE